MSFKALAWAAEQKTGGLATKSALLALANYADEYGCAYPSTAAIAAFGEMDHKTATVALDRLVSAGLVTDTGERAGRTKQVKVYRLALGSIPQTEAFQNRKPPASSSKAPQKRVTDTVREPVPQKASPSSARAKPEMRVKPARLADDWKPSRFADDTAARAVIDQRGREWGRAALESFRAWAVNAEDKDGKGRKRNWQQAWAKWVIEQDKADGRRNGTHIERNGASRTGYGRTADALADFVREAEGDHASGLC